jgi:hypothetical protein
MTKNQKIWFLIFLAMFAVPEVLWSPVSNVIFGLIKDVPYRINFLTQADNRDWLITIIFAQFLGILGVNSLLWFKKEYLSLKEGHSIFLFSLFLALVVLFVLYVLIATRNMSF